ncbi:hypothetical protein [Shewanella salipaludis]|uniref:Uncharacterized protein n=1 Tax=Shewanella salipaludis TaxID=2723052 RepID=A0A972FYF5_9GAMM|nr:hypothetical protein [Shewanella salipaludis]NMH64952.1 hypothetical protein [Shewanella salipaludis]
MSNIIQLFERMGQDAGLQSRDAQLTAIQATDLTAELKQALLANDAVSLERQLDIAPDIFCALFPAEDEQPTEEAPAEQEQDTIRMVANG